MRSKEWKVGLFSALSLGLLYLGFNYLKGKDFFQRKKYTMPFITTSINWPSPTPY